jgi:hypothetical protein
MASDFQKMPATPATFRPLEKAEKMRKKIKISRNFPPKTMKIQYFTGK